LNGETADNFPRKHDTADKHLKQRQEQKEEEKGGERRRKGRERPEESSHDAMRCRCIAGTMTNVCNKLLQKKNKKILSRRIVPRASTPAAAGALVPM